jgi:hypothetical protein
MVAGCREIHEPATSLAREHYTTMGAGRGRRLSLRPSLRTRPISVHSPNGVEVVVKEVRIWGRKAHCCAPSTGSSAKTVGFGVPGFAEWRTTVDEDGHYSFAVAL